MKSSDFGFFLVALVWCLIPVENGRAAIQTTLNEFTGSPAEVIVWADNVPGGVAFSVSLVSPQFADIRGVWLNIADDSLLLGLSVLSSTGVSSAVFGPASSVNNLGQGNNLNGGGSPAPFDIGLSFGTPGIGKDDFQSVSFTLAHSGGGLDVAEFVSQNVGVRLTSVGPSAGSRDGSSKLGGSLIANPEPGAFGIWLLLAAVGFVAARGPMVRRRA
jgi:hypothetical protein